MLEGVRCKLLVSIDWSLHMFVRSEFTLVKIIALLSSHIKRLTQLNMETGTLSWSYLHCCTVVSWLWPNGKP